MADYMPSADAAFTSWLTKFLTYLGVNYSELGLQETDVMPLINKLPIWNGLYSDHLKTQAAAIGATKEKDRNRTEFEALIRPLVGRIQSYPGTTDAARAALGITIKGSGTMSAQSVSSDDKPDVFVNVSSRLKHVLRVENSTDMGATKAKPSWAMACEVWRKIGETPSGEADLQYVGMFTRNPFTMVYGMEDAGKTVHYMLRWVSRKGEPGSWSETESATIAA